MLKEKELTDPNSCMNKAREGEMTFVLLARDLVASAAVRIWAHMRVLAGKNKVDDPQIIEAMQCADTMDEQRGTPVPIADGAIFAAVWDSMSNAVYTWAVNKGWWEGERNDGELIALMHSELSEGLEGLRHGNPPSEHIPEFSALEEEFADVVIRIMDMSKARGMRTGEAIVAKLAFNHTRPHKHGGKKF